MSANKTLIAYVSKQGATEESARKIAETLRAKFQLEVDLVDLKEQKAPRLSTVPEHSRWRRRQGRQSIR
jgi:menaquinone-dependent protoporphyrinogen IX oxidase